MNQTLIYWKLCWINFIFLRKICGLNAFYMYIFSSSGSCFLPQCIKRWISILLCRPAVPQQPAWAAAFHCWRQQDVSGKSFYLSCRFWTWCRKEWKYRPERKWTKLLIWETHTKGKVINERHWVVKVLSSCLTLVKFIDNDITSTPIQCPTKLQNPDDMLLSDVQNKWDITKWSMSHKIFFSSFWKSP